jgi:hypothetical protein
MEARHHWTEELVWVRSAATRLDPNRPVPLVAFCPGCTRYRIAVSILNQAGLDSDLVYSMPSIAGLAAAVEAGFGTMVISRNRSIPPQLSIWEDAPLPELPEVYCGIYIRESGDQQLLESLADLLAAALRPRDVRATRRQVAALPFTPASALGH